jgi:molecular chaperone GrpE
MMRKTKADKTKSEEVGDAATVAQVAKSGAERCPGEAADSESGAPAVTEKTAEAEAPTAPLETVSLVAELQAKVEKLEDSLYRAKADFQNLQRRSGIERGEAVRYANADLMKSLLPVVDDFERALTAAEASDNLEAIIAGVRLVYNNLAKALRDHGLETIEALHRPFDPNLHEALLQQPTVDYPSGTVVEQTARGYRLRDRVLRAAKVVVSKAADVEPAQGDGTGAVDRPGREGKKEA